jgi:hypothetical protein
VYRKIKNKNSWNQKISFNNNVNGLNSPIKRHSLDLKIKIKNKTQPFVAYRKHNLLTKTNSSKENNGKLFSK